MTAVMKYAGSISLEDLEADVKRRFDAGVGPDTVPKQNARSMRVDDAHTPLLKFFVVNLAGAAIAAGLYSRGWLDPVLTGDRTGLTLAIIAVFAAGLVLCGARLVRVGRETGAAGMETPPAGTWAADYLEAVNGQDSGARTLLASALQLRLGNWITVVRQVANSLVLLGLIGTVIGFIIALSGVNPDAVSDVKAISPMVSTLLSGMSVALYTTLAGAALNLWLMVNHRLLAGATSRLVAGLVERGERHERI
jgi:hypothetical protein